MICTWSQRVPIPGNPVFGLMLAVLTATALGVSVQRGLRPSPRLLLVILVCAACLLTDVIYVVQVGNNLTGWEDIAVPSTAGPGATETYSIADTLGGTDTKRFIRLKVAKP